MSQRQNKLLLACVIINLFAVACTKNENQKPSRTLEEIKTSGKLIVLTRNGSTTWYIGRDNEPTGPEYDMVEAFASHLGVKTEYKIKESVKAVLDGIENAEGDLAAAGLTITRERKKRFRFGPAYQDVTQQVVCRRDNIQPESIDDLVGIRLTVITESSYSEKLNQLKQTKYPELFWRETNRKGTEQLLEDVWRRESDCIIADSNIVDINRRYYPELIVSLNLTKSQQLGWVMPLPRKDLDRTLHDWFDDFKESGRLTHLQEKYYGFFEIFDYVDIRKYIHRINKRLPKYQTYFKEAAEKYNLPYLVLAAQGYQESHWNAVARSPTGVRGIMMLTLRTAKDMGVTNRLDPKQSIFGGAKYMAWIRQQLQDEIREPDLTWLSLAAYNVGLGHLRDAQKLAEEMALNPTLWRDVKQVLPLLSDKLYYQRLEHGYARGTEPIRYVQRIREYRHVLARELTKKN